LQSYCNSVLEQPKVDLGGFANLTKYQTDINSGLLAAQTHATTYLNTVQPAIITNVANISNYFDLHGAVSASLPPGATKPEWLDALSAVMDAANGYKADANSIVTLLSTLNSGLTGDVASFSQTVTQLNNAVNGDNGVLDSLNSQIDDIQSKINGAITGTVLSGLAIVGGSIMILVGALAEAVTGGLATALVVGGAAVLIAGIGGEAASGVALGGLLDQKADLITRGTTLRAEVQLALGLKTGFANLKDQVATAVQAATAMQNAWSFLESDLGNLASDLNKGIIGTDIIRTLWLNTANSAIQPVQTDIATIKQQMAGTSLRIAPKGTPIGTYVGDVAQGLAA
jgi:uncharacterized protein YukE